MYVVGLQGGLFVHCKLTAPSSAWPAVSVCLGNDSVGLQHHTSVFLPGSQHRMLTHPPVCRLAGHLEKDAEELRRGGVKLLLRHF